MRLSSSIIVELPTMFSGGFNGYVLWEAYNKTVLPEPAGRLCQR